MKLMYFADSDTLAIDLDERASSDTVEYSDDVLFDLDSSGNVSMITIEHASRYINVDRLETNIPIVEKIAEALTPPGRKPLIPRT